MSGNFLICIGLKWSQGIVCQSLPLFREISTKTAIRKALRTSPRQAQRPSYGDRRRADLEVSSGKKNLQRTPYMRKSRKDEEDYSHITKYAENSHGKRRTPAPRPEPSEFPKDLGRAKVNRPFLDSRPHNSRQQQEELQDPLPILYTTPASEFLYGTNVVAAALKVVRRKFYKLYIYQGQQENFSDDHMSIRRLALERGVPVERVPAGNLRLMDKMSAGRPHNGLILESSPLPKLPATALAAYIESQKQFKIVSDYQSDEERAINGVDPGITYNGVYSRYPFVLVLDGILDPGNLGAILRSAFFLGVDAVGITSTCTAPLSPVCLKASAGASEAIPLISIRQNGKFLDGSKLNGWKVFAADTPSATVDNPKTPKIPFSFTSNVGSPLKDKPCILLLGSEERGLFPDIRKRADRLIAIEGVRAGEAGVESLNVSVAAGLLIQTFLRGTESSKIKKGEPVKKTNVKNRLF